MPKTPIRKTFTHLFGGWRCAPAYRWTNPDGTEGGIVADWPEIVGPDLAAASLPERLAFPRGARRDGTFTAYHGYLIRDGVWSRLANGRREVLARDPGTGYPIRVRMTGSDELGRTLDAEGRSLTKLGAPLNPNMLSINCLTEGQINGPTGHGEDHENWTPAEARNFFRAFLGFASG